MSYKHFSISELTRSSTAEKYNIDNTPDEESLKNLDLLITNLLDPIRTKFGHPIRVSSGYRSETLNSHPKIKGANQSQHLKGEAADLVCEDNGRLFTIIREMYNNGEIEFGQLIDEKNYSWIHISLPTQRHHNEILHFDGRKYVSE